MADENCVTKLVGGGERGSSGLHCGWSVVYFVSYATVMWKFICACLIFLFVVITETNDAL